LSIGKLHKNEKNSRNFLRHENPRKSSKNQGIWDFCSAFNKKRLMDIVLKIDFDTKYCVFLVDKNIYLVL